MAEKPQAHPSFSSEELVVAAIGGLGLLLVILAGMFSAFGSAEELFGLPFTSLALLGLVLVAVALALWMVLLRPWQQYDDLETPYFTGHHHDEPHAPDHAEPRDEAVTYPAPATNIPADDAAAEEADEEADEEAVAQDDLTVIEGIGPKAQDALYAAKLTRYADVAEADEAALRAALDEAGLRGQGVETWAKQARFIVNKDVDSFENYKKELAAGRDPSGGVDDLKVIEGIGPKTEKILFKAGIATYAALADATPEQLREILAEAKLHMFNPDSWPKQARFAADGDIAGLDAYKQVLDGGVEPDTDE